MFKESGRIIDLNDLQGVRSPKAFVKDNGYFNAAEYHNEASARSLRDTKSGLRLSMATILSLLLLNPVATKIGAGITIKKFGDAIYSGIQARRTRNGRIPNSARNAPTNK